MHPGDLSIAAGIVAGTFVSGVFFSSSQMVIPLLYKHTPQVQTEIFTKFYWRGFAVVAPLAVASTTAFGYAAYVLPRYRTELSVAAALSLVPLPYTQLVMAKGIQTLIKCENNAVEQEKLGGQEILRLLQSWKANNMVRVAATGAGALLGLWILLNRKSTPQAETRL
jgi:hypothetical protein